MHISLDHVSEHKTSRALNPGDPKVNSLADKG